MVSFRALILTLLPLVARAASSESSDQSSCVNQAGFDKCVADADAALNTCVSDHCGDSVCVSSCKGDATCIRNNCSGVSKDCLDICECTRNTAAVACAARDCWNQVYSCGYDQLVISMTESCANSEIDLQAIPYFPAPDSAPGSCSCNQGKLYLTQSKILDHQNATLTNETMFGFTTNYDEQQILLKFREICPDTQPSLLLGGDQFGGDLFSKSAYDVPPEEQCPALLSKTDCAGEMGYGAAVGDVMPTYYAEDKLPPNGTETLYNKEGALATPTQATIVWTPALGDIPITIVAAQASKGTSKGSTTAASGATAASKAGNGATSGAQSATSAAASAPASTTPNAAPRADVSWFALTFCMVAMVVYF
ncbi:unnamed protein product [Aureobasidium mustum]|uniref:Uncharacterized protein n=1 Tax=Aureobasidium mustum TaxID=2773714 RepID=A0A9N8JVU0_9PEZI|nr:unnamed protein product [Aureobasidium mustum]